MPIHSAVVSGLVGCLVALSSTAVAEDDPCIEGPCYIDADGNSQNPARAYDRVVARQRPRYVIAGIELTAMIVGGAVWYGIDPEREVADWDIPSLKQRFSLEALRFDNNAFDINWLGHPFNGVWYHIYSRANDLSLPATIGFGFSTSLAWEYALEFNKKASVNDLLVTTGGGVAIGEFFYWMGRYFTSAPKNQRLGARWTFGIWQSAHRDDDNRGAPLDDLGFSSDIWHRFELSTGVALGEVISSERDESATPRVQRMSLRAEFAALPGYLRPGTFRASFAQGNLTELALDVKLGDGGVGVDLEATTTILGHHGQRLTRVGGRAATVGVTIGMKYRRHSTDSWFDRVGILHLPGPALSGHLRGPSWHLEVSVEGHGDFASLDAAAYPAWDAANPDVIGKAILARNRYYFGWGVSASARAVLTTPRLRLGGSLFGGRYASQQGLDRSQEDVEYDVPVNDRVIDSVAWVDVKPWTGRLTVRAQIERRVRRNQVDDTFSASKTLRQFSLQVGAVF